MKRCWITYLRNFVLGNKACLGQGWEKIAERNEYAVLQAGEILEEALSWGINLEKKQAQLLHTYYELLLTENKKYNLTRIMEPQAILEEHFFDSLAGQRNAGGINSDQLLDLGSGAGFPGIPIKIYCPGLKLVLLESNAKKISFLKMVVEKLDLHNVDLLRVRAEDFGRGPGRERFSWVTARAVAPLVVLLELALPLVKIGGSFWAYKGPGYAQELLAAEDILLLCGGQLVKKIHYWLPKSHKERNILIFKKMQRANERFPRRAGIPQKRAMIKK